VRLRHRATALVVLAAALPTTSTTAQASQVLSPTLSTATATRLFVGARANDIPFSTADQTIGPIAITRLFYPGELPATYTREDIPAGVKLIVSYKTASANTASYAASMPALDGTVIVYHHEPEGDYPSGAAFVSEFDSQAAVIHAANFLALVGFVAAGYQYTGGKTSSAGIGGSYIPSTADRYYEDSYQRSVIGPASKDIRVTNYLKELSRKGRHFDGFPEYGRGVIPAGGTFDAKVAADRSKVIPVDAAWLRSMGASAWLYWYTTDRATGDQWRFTDAASIKAWRAEAAK